MYFIIAQTEAELNILFINIGHEISKTVSQSTVHITPS